MTAQRVRRLVGEMALIRQIVHEHLFLFSPPMNQSLHTRQRPDATEKMPL